MSNEQWVDRPMALFDALLDRMKEEFLVCPTQPKEAKATVVTALQIAVAHTLHTLSIDPADFMRAVIDSIRKAKNTGAQA